MKTFKLVQFVILSIIFSIGLKSVIASDHVITQLTNNTYPDYQGQNSKLVNYSGSIVWMADLSGNGSYDSMGWEIFLYDGKSIIQITNNEVGDRFPSINDSGDITWQSFDGQNWSIFFYDSQKKNIEEISSDTNPSALPPQINNDGSVVYEGYGNGDDTEIFLYNGSTIQQLTDNDYNDNLPKINNNGYVVWFGYKDGVLDDREIFLFDGITVHQITDDTLSNQYPWINDKNNIVWQSSEYSVNYSTEIFFYDGESKQITQITNNSIDDLRPRINNKDNIVWVGGNDNLGSDIEIYFYDSDSNSTHMITDDSYLDYRPYINDKNDIVWMKGPDEIYLFINNTKEVFNLTQGEYVGEDPQINNAGYIVWSGHSGGDNPNQEIFYMKMKNSIDILIDIKPGTIPNCMKINGHGMIKVAILGSTVFAVTEVDINTLNFAGLDVHLKGNSRPQCSFKDVSGDFTDPAGSPDGYDDLVCHFVDDADAWSPDDGTATLTGKLLDGTPIEGTDSICIVP